MSAPQIPNLLTLRGRGGRPRRSRGPGRGTGRDTGRGIGHGLDPDSDGGRGWDGGGSGTSTGSINGSGAHWLETDNELPAEEIRRRKTEIIRQTDDDANGSRLSAVAAGLMHDPYAAYFGDMANAPRRMPIINRGTAARTLAVNRLIDGFLAHAASENSRSQIVSLGAGSDTRIFNLLGRKIRGLTYHEVDLQENVHAKLAIINRNPKLRSMLTGDEKKQVIEGTVITPESSSNDNCEYQIVSCDLRELGKRDNNGSSAFPFMKGVRSDTPTLILSECCLCYLQIEDVKSVLGAIIGKDHGLLSEDCPAGLVFYEPIKPNDSFGMTMKRNLSQRGIEMPTIGAFPSLSAQRARFLEYGFVDGGRAIDIDRVFQTWLTGSERDTIDHMNPLDELEEWQMLAQHYCISWGWRGSFIKESWQQLPE